MEKIAIAVGTCKKYSDVAFLFNKANRDFLSSYEVFFLTDEFINELSNEKQIIDSSNSWSKRIARSLTKLNTSHILFFLDDYFFHENVVIPKFINLENIGYMRLVNIPQTTSIHLDTEIDYSINFQPALWNRELLINILKHDNFSPWEAEINLNYLYNSYNTSGKEKLFLNIVDSYLNAVIKGEWSRLVLQYQIDISKSDRAVMSHMSWIFFKIKSFLIS